MEEMRALDSGKAPTLHSHSRHWWPLLSTARVIIYGYIISLPAIWYRLRVPKIDIIMARLFSRNISINLSCTVGSLGMWLQGGAEFRRGLWRLRVGRGCSVDGVCRIISSWSLSDSRGVCDTANRDRGRRGNQDRVDVFCDQDTWTSLISPLSPLAHNPCSSAQGIFNTSAQSESRHHHNARANGRLKCLWGKNREFAYILVYASHCFHSMKVLALKHAPALFLCRVWMLFFSRPRCVAPGMDDGWNISTIGWIAVKCYADVHGPQKMNPVDVLWSPDLFLECHHEVDTFSI